jgi:hypothetical protein
MSKVLRVLTICCVSFFSLGAVQNAFGQGFGKCAMSM